MKTQKTNTYLRLIAMGIVAFSFFGTSCTSLQQSTTVATDDLYYTPNKKVVSAEKLVAIEKAENGMAQDEEYQEYQNYQDDRFLRLKVANRNRWSAIDDFGYWNNPRFNMGFGMGWGGGFGGWGFDPFWGGGWGGGFGGWGGGFGGWGGGFGGWAGGLGGWAGGLGGWGGGFGGWGFDPFWGGGFGGWGGGFGGWGGGFGGWGGWNPYFAGYWNPYMPIYYGVGFVNNGGRPYQSPSAVRSSPSSINAYRNNRGYNNTNNSVNTTTGNIRYTSNPTLNSNFGNLMKRVVTNNGNTNYANSYDRPARYFSNNNNYNGGNQNQSNSNNNNKTSFQSNSNSNAGGRSGGFNSSGISSSSPRAARIP